MALTPTLLQDAVILIEDGKSYNDFEKRHDQYGAMQAFDANANMMLSKTQVENMKKSVVQVEKIPVFNRYSPAIITDASCAITGGRPTTAFAQLNWAYVGFEVTIIPSQNEANYKTEAEDLAWQMMGGWRGIFENLDTKSLTALETNKSTSLVQSTLKNVITNASDYTYSGDEKEMFLQVPSLMQINSINGAYEDVANTESQATRALIDAFGADNYYDVNGAIKRNGNFRHYLTNRLTVPDGSREAHYIFPMGSVGMYNWITNDARVGRTAGNKKWDSIKDPMFGFDWELYSIEDCVDDTAVSGNKRAYGYKAQFGAYFSFLTQYRSGNESPIIKMLRNDQA